MMSEDVEKIFALIIVTLSYLSVPILLFLFVVLIIIDANYVIQYYARRTVMDALMAVLLAIVNTGLFFFLRALVKWIRK
jgi:hypothetical protein